MANVTARGVGKAIAHQLITARGIGLAQANNLGYGRSQRSPFARFANATLIFDVPTGSTTVNALGNRVPKMESVEISAYLNALDDAITVQYYVGEDDTATLMEGYLVQPLVLPSAVHPPIEGQASIQTAYGVYETGKIKLIPITQSAALMRMRIMWLTKIRGIFTRE